jgi:hypothetical protein
MTIRRLFEPDPESLERVVEILYALLVPSPTEPEGSGDSGPNTAEGSPCVSTEQEE